MNPAAKFYVSLAVALVIGVGAALLGGTVNKWREGYMQNQQRGQTLQTTSGIIADNDASAAEAGKTDNAVATAANQYAKGYDDAKRNEPETADRADRPVPASVRKLARERRIQRERSGRPLVGSEEEPGAAPAPQR